jgi:hypothetical protein
MIVANFKSNTYLVSLRKIVLTAIIGKIPVIIYIDADRKTHFIKWLVSFKTLEKYRNISEFGKFISIRM